MNRVRLFLTTNTNALVLAGVLLFMLGVASDPAAGQQRNDVRNGAARSADSAADNEYTRKIKEYTTEPHFRTELSHTKSTRD